MKQNISVVILAAGEGKRMKSATPKVLHSLLGKPILFWVIDLAKRISDDIVVVLGHNFEVVKSSIEKGGYGCLSIVKQKQLNGTGGAVKCVLPFLNKEFTLIACGDMPLLKYDSMQKLVEAAMGSNTGAMLVCKTNQKGNYGRVWIDDKGYALKVVESTDLLLGQDSNIINVGAYVIRTTVLKEIISELRCNNKQGEYYLTDIVKLLADRSSPLKVVFIDEKEALGINSRKDLALAEKEARERIIDFHFANGVTICMPETVLIEVDVAIGMDTVIMPFTVIRKNVEIGKYCKIGPFAHIRSGTMISDGCVVGNFVEVNRSVLGEKVYAKHLTYLGDTVVGRGTNIGAGTITANFDGKEKNKTTIGMNSFIGSGAILIAPVKIGNHAVVGAGAVVTKCHDVGDGETVVGLPARSIKKM